MSVTHNPLREAQPGERWVVTYQGRDQQEHKILLFVLDVAGEVHVTWDLFDLGPVATAKLPAHWLAGTWERLP